MTLLRVLAVFLAPLLLLVKPVAAHEGRPLFVQIIEGEPGNFNMFAAVPLSVPNDNQPELKLGGACDRIVGKEDTSAQTIRRYRCDGPRLQGATLDIDFPRGNPAVTTLVLARMADGSESVQTIPPDMTSYSFEKGRSAFNIAIDYIWLGVVHILGGIDHLLFVFGLFLLARDWRQLLIVLTGFTIAHSLTLTASTLGWVNIPIAPTEAVIALSIVFVARELLRNEGSLAKRFPVIVAFAFGLLHGFGFASVLRETGLPQDNLLTALLFFNVGVEMGQIAFVLFLMLSAAGLRAIVARWPRELPTAVVEIPRQTRLAAYALGAIATMWFLERSVAMFA